jgi:hypothetical protein
MPRRVPLPPTVRKRGNPNWGQPITLPPSSPSEFEMQVRQLGLAPETYVYSAELRAWCERNKDRFYVPEWLLEEWGIAVDPNASDAA